MIPIIRRHWWLIVWSLIVLIVLALAEGLPAGQEGRVWLEMINSVLSR